MNTTEPNYLKPSVHMLKQLIKAYDELRQHCLERIHITECNNTALNLRDTAQECEEVIVLLHNMLSQLNNPTEGVQ